MIVLLGEAASRGPGLWDHGDHALVWAGPTALLLTHGFSRGMDFTSETRLGGIYLSLLGALSHSLMDSVRRASFLRL